MSELISEYSFRLICKNCDNEFQVISTREFKEKPSNETKTAYYDRELKLVGISSGTGDTFHCKYCHAWKWVQDKKKEKSYET